MKQFWQFLEDLNEILVPEQNEYEEEIAPIKDPGDSTELKAIHLSGKDPFRDLLADIREGLKSDVENNTEINNQLSSRFIATISSSLTGIGRNQQELEKVADDLVINLQEKFTDKHDLQLILNNKGISNIQKSEQIDQKVKASDWKEIGDYIKEFDSKIFEQESVISDHDRERISVLISEASSQLVKELGKECKSSSFWKYTHSVDRSAKQRHILNFAGRIYDVMENMCHNIGKVMGISQSNAAELFVKAAEYAKEVRFKLEKNHQLNQEKLTKEAENNVQYYDLKQKGLEDLRLPEDILKEVEEHKAKALMQQQQQLISQYGVDVAQKALRERIENSWESIEPDKESMRNQFDSLYNAIKALPNKEQAQKTNIHLAMDETEKVLFPREIQIGSEFSKPRLDKEKISHTLKDLEKAVVKTNDINLLKQFKVFEKEVDTYAPKKTWAQKLGIIGASGRERD